VSGGDCSHSAEGSQLWLAPLSKLRNAPNWSKLHGSHFIQETTIHFDSHFAAEKMSLQMDTNLCQPIAQGYSCLCHFVTAI